jgi:hypothetical protein
MYLSYSIANYNYHWILEDRCLLEVPSKFKSPEIKKFLAVVNFILPDGQKKPSKMFFFLFVSLVNCFFMHTMKLLIKNEQQVALK